MPSPDPGAPAAHDIIGPELADVVSRLRRAMRRAARAVDPQARLSVAQLELLSCLAENPGARPGQVARLLRLAPSTETTLANGLRRAGLVTRVGGEEDRRTASLGLTPAGEVAVSRWQQLNERLLRAALEALAPVSREALTAALPALRELADAIDVLAESPPAESLPAESLPAESLPAESPPAESPEPGRWVAGRAGEGEARRGG